MKNTNNKMIENLFFKLLPIQVLIIAMSSINSIVDGVIAGRFIDSTTVGVVGLFYVMVNVLNAIGNTMLGGTSVLCGRYMGSGDIKKTENVFSVNIATCLLVGAILTLLSLFGSNILAIMLGATEALKPSLMLYIKGYAIGIIPQLLAQQIASFLQLERQNKRSYIGIGAMIITNIATDIIFVSVMKLGIFGLAIATSVSNIIYFLILGQYYLSGKSQLKLKFKGLDWSVLKDIIVIGVPGALLVFCLALRGLVINRLLLQYGGNDGLSAMSAFNMISGLFIAYCLGSGAVVRMLVSIFVGEENKDAIKNTLKVAFSKGLGLTLIITALVIILSGGISSIFFDDPTSNVFILNRQIVRIFGACIPMVLACCVFTNYLQALGHNLMVNIISTFDGFFSMVIPSLLLAPIIGIMGIWLANPIGIFLTMMLTPIYVIIRNKHIPKNSDEALLLSNIGVSENNRLSMNIETIEDVRDVAMKVEEFTKNHNLSYKTSYYASLSLEEMAGNVVEHGFKKDNKKHLVEAQIVYKEGDITLRIKDDCVPFNPKERAKIISPNDPMKNIGVRMITKIADELIYQNLIGLNISTIKFKGKSLSN